MFKLSIATNTATDYTYYNNGNLLKDRKKDIGTAASDGIVYNHLNIPYQITVEGKGTIMYKYDALGNKLAKITKDTVTGNKTTTTDYLNGFVYENNVLQFFAHESGRVRIKNTVSPSIAAGYSYDYFIKDHLGNTRVVLTDEQQQDVYPLLPWKMAPPLQRACTIPSTLEPLWLIRRRYQLITKTTMATRHIIPTPAAIPQPPVPSCTG